MGFGDWINSTFGDSNGKGGVGNILGGLSTAAQIYQNYSQGKKNDQVNSNANALAQAKLDEDRRQFDLTFGLKKDELALAGEGAGAGSADALKIAKSNAIAGAYRSMIDAVQNGRNGEAAILSKLIDQFRAVNSQA